MCGVSQPTVLAVSWTRPSNSLTDSELDQDFEALFSDALEELLNAARLATVETGIHRGKAKQVSSSTIEVAKAELALRDGQNLSAQTFAQGALAMAKPGKQ